MELTTLAESIRANKYNPQNIFYVAVQALEAASNGTLVIGDATNPIAALYESMSVVGAVNNDEIERLQKLGSPQYATNIDELSVHLDYDELTLIHAIPGTKTFTMLLPFSELVTNSVKLTETTSKLTIPKESVVQYDETLNFGLHHDIDIIISNGTSVDVSYVANSNPLVSLTHPIIPTAWRKRYQDDEDDLWLEIQITLHQFTRQTEITPVTSTTGFTATYSIDDDYYHARVYNLVDGNWIELNTAFSDFLYNPNSTNGTAIISVDDSTVTIHIPQIFFTEGIIVSDIKVELLTTKGEYDLSLTGGTVNNYGIKFTNLDSTIAEYVSAMRNVGQLYIVGDMGYTTGSVAPTFKELQATIIAGENANQPVTLVQLTNILSTKGYTLSHDRNYLTENMYLASKKLPAYTTGSITTMISAGNVELALSNLAITHGVIQNDKNFTITPDAIAVEHNGIGTLLTTDEATALIGTSTEELHQILNTSTYLCPLFYYALENGDYNHTITPFNLEAPSITDKDYMGTNPNADGMIATKDIVITKSKLGYTIDILAAISSAYSELPVDAFIPQLTYLNASGMMFSLNGITQGQLDDGSYVFSFELETTYDLSAKGDYGTIVYENLTDSINGLVDDTPILQTFDLTYNLITDQPLLADIMYQDKTDNALLPDGYQVVTYERITVKLGEILPILYTPIKSYKGTTEYQTYIGDVPAVYDEDVYEEEDGVLVFTVNEDYDEALDASETNQPVMFNLLHREGDAKVDANGDPIYIARAGDLVLDSYDQPIVKSTSSVELITKLTMADYKFNVVGELDTIRGYITDDISTDLMPLADKMLELTELNYNVASSTGTAAVKYDSDTSGTISNAMTMTLSVVVNAVTYKDVKTRASIMLSIKEAIVANLDANRTFSVNRLTKEIESIIGDHVMGFSVVDVDGKSDMITFTPTNDEDVIGIKSIIGLDDDGAVVITDGITINFKQG